MELTFLCITNEVKGLDYVKACKEAGNKVFLITSDENQDALWPRQYIDDIFFVRMVDKYKMNYDDIKAGLNHFAKANRIDRIVALDDFDVDKAAELREHFRIPGMGTSKARFFRDKLAMRIKAAEAGMKVPGFSALFHDEEINAFVEKSKGPWVVKPRSEASASGIRKVHNLDELWQVVHELGEERPNYLVEEFKPGTVYHVDALSKDGKVVFARASQYINTPMEVAHDGGIFRSAIMEFGSEDEKALNKFNKKLLKEFGLELGASHTEFIKANEDGEFYFLETSSRVGGANLAEMVEFASGVNLWAEWARIENAVVKGEEYKVDKGRKDYAGIVVSLSRFQNADYHAFKDPEVVWRLQKDYHVGLILKSGNRERILSLLDEYAGIVQRDFHTHVG